MWGGGGELKRETAGEGRATARVPCPRSPGSTAHPGLGSGPRCRSMAELSPASALSTNLRSLTSSLLALQHVCARPGWGRVPYQQGVTM